MRKLGKYEVLGELGHGAMGVVYRARDPIINRMVALKTITTGLAEDPNLLQRFYREAQSAGGLQHPNIVTIYDMGDEQNTPYIAMELIEGESLEQMIARGAHVPLALKLTYALQACRAFDYAHKRGIVHRDIKPGNVMVNKESVVKVVDFGIARVLDTSKTQTGMLIGTFTYMSPEQYHGEHADERSDIWSFGVLLYELVYYQRPFTGENPASLMHSICLEEPRFPRDRVPDCPPAVENVISKILRKSPQDRFQSMEDLLLELEPIYKELQAQSIDELIDRSRQLIDKGEFASARELLRESLKVDSANAQARTLLERVNAQLKRLAARPKAQQQVDKGSALLKEGKIQEARAEAVNALQLDSTFEPAQDLLQQIQRELDRAQMVVEWIQAAAQHLAEGAPDEAEKLLAKVFEIEPANRQAKDLQQQVLAEKAERQRRLWLVEKMREARTLWTQSNYDDSIGILSELQKEFPGEEEIQRLMETVREDQAEQHKQKALGWARNFLTLGNHSESLTLLEDLRNQFPNDEEVSRLLEEVRLDEVKQRRLQGLAEARAHLANRQYDESIAMLTALEKEFREDREILQLLEMVRADQADQQRQQSIGEAQNLLAAGRYEECTALVADLRRRFPSDKEISELQKAIRAAQIEQRRQEGLEKARNLLTARRYGESIKLLVELEKEFPADEGEISNLLDRARAEEAEQERQKGIEQVRNLLTARGFGGSNLLLAKLLKQFPNDSELLELQKTVRAEEEEQKRLQGIAEARNLLAARRYEECDALLEKLRGQFPNDSELRELQKALTEDQAEQRKLESLTKARNLLASRNYQASITILAGLEEEFPSDETTRRLLKTAREEHAEQHKQQAIVEVRNLLTARRYDDCSALLVKLEGQYPSDLEIRKLQESVLQDKAEQEKLATLVKARNLLAKRNYQECVALLTELGREFPKDVEIPRLLAAARDGLAEQRKLRSLGEARSLLGAGRYDESVLLLTELKQGFPDDREIPNLLASATREQAEQQKQQKLAEARALLAAQRFDEALELLGALRAAHPKDKAVQKLVALVERERDKQTRSERLQRELEALKEFVSEKKYAELLARAEPLRTDFPTNADLLRLIDFARGQQTRIENEKRLRSVIDNVQAQMSQNRFADALRAAEAGLKAFPQNSELAYLREQAEAQEKKQRARGMIEQQIREIKFKINRQDLSEAIELAKQTLATAGPDTELTQLLNSATVELQGREKRRRQEQKLEEIRTLVESGDADRAAQKLTDAVETDVFDALDPRVSRVSQEIDAAKNPSIAAPSEPSVPSGFSKEYAFLQGAPPGVEPPATDELGAAASSVPQASATQPSLSSQSTVPMPPPQFVAVPPATEAPVAIPPSVEPVADTPVALKPVESTPVLKRTAPIATQTVPIARPRDFKKNVMLAAVATALILGVWAAAHLLPFHRNQKASISPSASDKGGVPLGQPNNGRITTTPQPTTTPTVPATPAVNPAEAEQRSAIALSDKLVASGDLKGALESLRRAEKLSGPLTAEIKNRETTVERRQKEDEIFRRAQEGSLANDQPGLRHADDLFNQVIALNGPRKSEAEQLRRNVEAKLATLVEEAASQKILALQSAGRLSIQQGDLNSARQTAEQIKQAGGDPAELLKEIDQAQANQARAAEQARQFQQALQSYNALDSRDKAGLEKSRSDFIAIVRGNGPRASDAQQYVANINRKLDALNQPPPTAPAPAVKKQESSSAADESAVRSVMQKFFDAFEQRDVNSLREVWPTIPRRSFDAYKNSFAEASAIGMRVTSESVKIDPGGTTATATAQSEYEYTPKGQQAKTPLQQSWTFQMTKSNGTWVIAAVR